MVSKEEDIQLAILAIQAKQIQSNRNAVVVYNVAKRTI
jgi:hypothetical protein